jgi:signal transduction histidine kinase
MDLIALLLFIVLIAIFSLALFFYFKNVDLKKKIYNSEIKITEKEKEMNNKMYELAILKELGDRVNYSLDVHQIIDVITGSLHQFINYSAVSYMLLDPEKIIFKIHLEKSVNRTFIDEVKERMIRSLGALSDVDITKRQIDELISGAILIEEVEESVKSFFNIPLVIANKVVGVLTVADTQSGLYKESEMTILYKITNQASQAVTKLQEVVSTEQAKLNAMVSSMADGIVMTDLDYRIFVINSSAKRAIGIQEDKDVSIFDFVDNLGGKFDIRGRLEESIKFKKEYKSDRIFLGEKFFQIFIFPVKSLTPKGEEKIYGGLIIFHDITSEVEIENLRKDFTSMLVHELRSPLDGIKKISEVLKNEKIQLDKNNYNEYIELIFRNSSSMLLLVNDILDVAKIEAGKFEIKKTNADIKKAINDRVNFYSILARSKNVKLNTYLSDNIPEQMMFDIEGIEHVLNNLISNALKYSNQEVNIIAFMHQKGLDIKQEAKLASYNSENILPSLINDKDSLIILISDNGNGISEEDKNTLFSKYKQISNNASISKGIKGTGLGLVIAKSIIEEHQGEIGVISKVNFGSTFFFSLPKV